MKNKFFVFVLAVLFLIPIATFSACDFFKTNSQPEQTTEQTTNFDNLWNINFGNSSFENGTTIEYSKELQLDAQNFIVNLNNQNISSNVELNIFVLNNGQKTPATTFDVGTYVAQFVYQNQTTEISFDIVPASFSEQNLTSNLNKSYPFDENGVFPTPEVYFNNQLLTKNVDYVLTYGQNNTAGKNAGSVMVLASGNYAANHEIVFYFDIEPKTVPEVVVNDKTLVYSGQPLQDETKIDRTQLDCVESVSYEYFDLNNTQIFELLDAGTYKVVAHFDMKQNYAQIDDVQYFVTIEQQDISNQPQNILNQLNSLEKQYKNSDFNQSDFFDDVASILGHTQFSVLMADGDNVDNKNASTSQKTGKFFVVGTTNFKGQFEVFYTITTKVLTFGENGNASITYPTVYKNVWQDGFWLDKTNAKVVDKDLNVDISENFEFSADSDFTKITVSCPYSKNYEIEAVDDFEIDAQDIEIRNNLFASFELNNQEQTPQQLENIDAVNFGDKIEFKLLDGFLFDYYITTSDSYKILDGQTQFKKYVGTEIWGDKTCFESSVLLSIFGKHAKIVDKNINIIRANIFDKIAVDETIIVPQNGDKDAYFENYDSTTPKNGDFVDIVINENFKSLFEVFLITTKNGKAQTQEFDQQNGYTIDLVNFEQIVILIKNKLSDAVVLKFLTGGQSITPQTSITGTTLSWENDILADNYTILTQEGKSFTTTQNSIDFSQTDLLSQNNITVFYVQTNARTGAQDSFFSNGRAYFENTSKISMQQTSLSYLGQNFDLFANTQEELKNILFFAMFYRIENIKCYIQYTTNYGNEISTILSSYPEIMSISYNFSNSADLLSINISFYHPSTPTLRATGEIEVKQSNKIVANSTHSTRADDFDNFAVESRENSMLVFTSDQLYVALQNGFKPIFASNTCPAKTVFDKAKEILRQIVDDSMTELEKTNAIYDWLSYNIKYDYNLLNLTERLETSINTPQSILSKYKGFYIEGVLLDDGQAVCDGISKTFVLLTNLENITCYKVSGTANGGGHAWNKILLDLNEEIDGSEWYTIDLTWGDTTTKDQNIYTEYLSHSYYLVTDDMVQTNSHTETNPCKNNSTTTYNYYQNTILTDGTNSQSLFVSNQAELDKLFEITNNLGLEGVEFMADTNTSFHFDSNLYNVFYETLKTSSTTSQYIYFALTK